MTDSTASRKEQLEAAKFIATMLGSTSLLDALEDGRTFRWMPQRDITTFELALCQFLAPLVISGRNWDAHHKIYDVLPVEAQRHFCVITEESEHGTGREVV